MGEDEETYMWRTCKALDGFLEVHDNRTCGNLFVCDHTHFLELDRLCDGKEYCQRETDVCHAARSSVEQYGSPIGYNGVLYTIHCVPGLDRIENLLGPCAETTFENPNYPTFGVAKETRIRAPIHQINCDYLFGVLYVHLSCLNKCREIECPLQILGPGSCSKNSFLRTTSYSSKGHLTFVTKSRGTLHNDLFECKNMKCVSYLQVCNHINDCGDNSDEYFCGNNFQCKTGSKFIQKGKMCDGIVDCADFSDECNGSCGKSLIPNKYLKMFAWLIGILGITLNSVTALRHPNISKTNYFAVINNSFRMLISLGDFMIGAYLVAIVMFDMLILGDDYCFMESSWLSSPLCATLGVVNTFGTNISIYSMACLSIFRVYNLQRIGVEMNKTKWILIALLMSSVMSFSFLVSIIPLLNNFKDFFVNGLKYEKDIRLFFGSADKEAHIRVIEAYHGVLAKRDLSWDEIQRLFDYMFTKNYGEIARKKIHFYGNDGVCVFKYFVTNNDPQNVYVWINLMLIFIATLVIVCCYLTILIRANISAKKVRKMMANDGSRNDHKSDKLQKCVTRIILTDLICWIPFLFICVLHSFESLDATPYYAIFSIAILPINSIINPIIYDDHFITTLQKINSWFKQIRSSINNSKQDNPQEGVIEMNPLESNSS